MCWLVGRLSACASSRPIAPCVGRRTSHRLSMGRELATSRVGDMMSRSQVIGSAVSPACQAEPIATDRLSGLASPSGQTCRWGMPAESDWVDWSCWADPALRSTAKPDPSQLRARAAPATSARALPDGRVNASPKRPQPPALPRSEAPALLVDAVHAPAGLCNRTGRAAMRDRTAPGRTTMRATAVCGYPAK